MEDKLEEFKNMLRDLQKDVDELKDVTQNGIQEKYRELLEKVDKLEGNLGVDKVILTDVGERILVTVQTPLGSVQFPLSHTPNTSKSNGGKDSLTSSISANLTSHTAYPAQKSAPPPAGMTPEQLQDFKKQGLQINTLQQKIKELESKLTEANAVIKKGQGISADMEKKEMEDVKEIFMYLDNINTTMSEKIANQRVEMEKLAGDVPEPINYDPFNYGEAYSGDIVDFQARKRILEIKLLLQGLQVAMNQIKDSVHVSPAIDLGYKVVRLDQLIESTGFGQAVQNGEVTRDNGLLINQAEVIDPPENRYPRNEMFKKDEDKESTWAVTDSIMQTMYRLESELGDLQKLVGSLDVAGNLKDLEDLASSIRQSKSNGLDEDGVRFLVQKEVKSLMTFMRESVRQPVIALDNRISQTGVENIMSNVKNIVNDLKTRLQQLEEGSKRHKIEAAILKSNGPAPACMTCDESIQRPVYKGVAVNLPSMPRFSPFTSRRLDSYYKQPVRLRTLMQRIHKYEMMESPYDLYQIPRPCGRGYTQSWPIPKPNQEERPEKVMPASVEPASQEYMLKGKDGRWYKGDLANNPTVAQN